MKTTFFRIDLNLQNFWWHRLLIVLFLISSIGLFGNLVKKEVNNIQFPSYIKVCKFSDRVDSHLREIGDLMLPNEIYAQKEVEIYRLFDVENFYKKMGIDIFVQKTYHF